MIMKKITRDEFKKRRQAKGFCACNNCIDDEIRLQEAIEKIGSGIEEYKRKLPLLDLRSRIINGFSLKDVERIKKAINK